MILKNKRDQESWIREKSIETMKSNPYIELDDIICVAGKNFYQSTSSQTDIPLQNGLYAQIINSEIIGNISTASKLKNARSINLIGEITGTTNFDGSQNVNIETSIPSIDANKITSGILNTERIPNLDASKITSGIIDIERLPAGALERLIEVENDDARFSLTKEQVQLGDTVKVAETLKMYKIINEDHLNSEEGYTVYVAGRAAEVPWSGVTGKPLKFVPEEHTHQADEIIENENKKFVSSTEKTRWNDTYTKQEVNQFINNATTHLFKTIKTNLNTLDREIISSYFSQNSDVIPVNGDIFLIETIIDEKIYERTSYIYQNDWEAITGNLDPDRIILRGKIKLAGKYTQVGNIVKGINETKDLDVDGMSLTQFHQSIFTAKLQPENPTQPSISGFSLSGVKAVEAGTKITATNWTQGNFNKGSYQYGPLDTGVVANSWSVSRVTNVPELNIEIATSNIAGSDNNGGTGFIIGDQDGENVVNSLKYTMTVNHSDGVVAYDNLGGNSNPEKKIIAGSKSVTTAAYTPYRNYFYGSTPTEDLISTPVDSSYIRTLTKSNKAYTKGDIMVNVKPGDTRVVIACISTVPGVTRVINTSALNADVTGTFKKSTVKVEGAEGYTSVDYNVWTFEPAEAYAQRADLKVTLG